MGTAPPKRGAVVRMRDPVISEVPEVDVQCLAYADHKGNARDRVLAENPLVRVALSHMECGRGDAAEKAEHLVVV
jgi:hypothetical protein